MGRRVVLIHGWRGYPQKGWLPWLKEELEQRGFDVSVPAMPDAENPKLEAWVDCLKKTVGTPDTDCFLVGHSLGCMAILRYCETLGDGGSIGGAVLVAGKTETKRAVLEAFFSNPLDWQAIRSHCRRFVALHSDNDPSVPESYGAVFKEKLGAQVIIQPGMKHFSGDDGITELPIVLDSVLQMAGR